MRIEEEIKLDYSDVLFRPKRSTLSSRKDVNLNRTYKFKYSNNEWSGIPIMAANLDELKDKNLSIEIEKIKYNADILTKPLNSKNIKQI